MRHRSGAPPLSQGSGSQELARGQLAACRSLGAQARSACPRCADRGCRRTYYGGLHAVVPLHYSPMDDTTRYLGGIPVQSRSTDDDTLCKYSSTLIIILTTYTLNISLIIKSYCRHRALHQSSAPPKRSPYGRFPKAYSKARSFNTSIRK